MKQIVFWTMAVVAVAANALVACGPVNKCGPYIVREDGAVCRECVDHAECHMETR